jgi:predicted O-methyltransferase YrrM
VLRKALRLSHSIVASGPRAVLLTRAAQHRGALQKTREFAGLIAFLRRRTLGVVVEIGTFDGGTLWTWCQIAEPNALLVSIDLPREMGGRASGDSDSLRSFARDGQRIELVRDDSHADRTLARVRDILDGREIDLLFIDGDHTDDGVRRDYQMYAPLVGRGGVTVFHDVLPHPEVPGCEVHRLWDELRRANRVEEFIDANNTGAQGQWGGIGVVYANGSRVG